MERDDLNRYRKLLLAKRAELLAPRPGVEAPVPGARVGEGDVVDQAVAATNAEVQVRLRQTDSRLLRAIEEALARLARGAFGVCTVCEQPISKARLDAVPWTRLCRECKEQPNP